MHKVQLKIHHNGCWGSDINLKFPNMQFSSVDCRWVKGEVVHILLARGSPAQFERVKHYLEKRKKVTAVESLSEDEHTMYLRVSTIKSFHKSQFSDIFFEHECFPVAPTQFKGKYEFWTLGSAKRSNITETYNAIKEVHPTTITYLREEKITQPLTRKQRESLTYAEHFGYYEWPRKKSASEICKIIGISKTAFLSRLRHAESKIIAEFIQQNK